MTPPRHIENSSSLCSAGTSSVTRSGFRGLDMEEFEQSEFLDTVKEYMGVEGTFFEPDFMAADTDGFVTLQSWPAMEVRIFDGDLKVRNPVCVRST